MYEINKSTDEVKTFCEAAWNVKGDPQQLSQKTFKDSQGNTFKINICKTEISTKLVDINEMPKMGFGLKICFAIFRFFDKHLGTKTTTIFIETAFTKHVAEIEARQKAEVISSGWKIVNAETGLTNIGQIFCHAKQLKTTSKPVNHVPKKPNSKSTQQLKHYESLVNYAKKIEKQDPEKSALKMKEAESVLTASKAAQTYSEATQKLIKSGETIKDADKIMVEFPDTAAKWHRFAEANIQKIINTMTLQEIIEQAQIIESDYPEIAALLIKRSIPDAKTTQNRWEELIQQAEAIEAQDPARAANLLKTANLLKRADDLTQLNAATICPEQVCNEAEAIEQENLILSKLIERREKLLRNAPTVTQQDETFINEELTEYDELMVLIENIKPHRPFRATALAELAKIMKHRKDFTQLEANRLNHNEIMNNATDIMKLNFEISDCMKKDAEKMKQDLEASSSADQIRAKKAARQISLMKRAEALKPKVGYLPPMRCPFCNEKLTPENVVMVTLNLNLSNYSASDLDTYFKAYKPEMKLAISKNGLSKLILKEKGIELTRSCGKDKAQKYSVMINSENILSVDAFSFNHIEEADHQPKISVQTTENRKPLNDATHVKTKIVLSPLEDLNLDTKKMKKMKEMKEMGKKMKHLPLPESLPEIETEFAVWVKEEEIQEMDTKMKQRTLPESLPEIETEFTVWMEDMQEMDTKMKQRTLPESLPEIETEFTE